MNIFKISALLIGIGILVGNFGFLISSSLFYYLSVILIWGGVSLLLYYGVQGFNQTISTEEKEVSKPELKQDDVTDAEESEAKTPTFTNKNFGSFDLDDEFENETKTPILTNKNIEIIDGFDLDDEFENESDEVKQELDISTPKVEEENFVVIKDVGKIYEEAQNQREIKPEERKKTKEFMEQMKNKKREEINEDDFLIYILSKAFESQGMEPIISDRNVDNDETMQFHSKLWLRNMLNGLDSYKMTFKEDALLSYEYLKSNPNHEKKFIEDFKNLMSTVTNIPKSEIEVIKIFKGSLGVMFTSSTLFEMEKALEKMKNIQNQVTDIAKEIKDLCGRFQNVQTCPFIESLLLNKSVFDHRFDMDYTQPHFKDRVETRGQEKYFFPYGWKRVGLNMGYFKYSDLNWLTMSNHENEWSVAYHGLRVDPKGTVGKIIDQGFKAGAAQACQGHVNLNRRNLYKQSQTCGIGVYCTPKIEVAEGYTTGIDFDKKRYRIAFQCRINPKKFNDAGGDYYVINESSDIRPYGLLYKCSN